MTGLGGRCDADWLRHRLESTGADERGDLMLVDCRPASDYGAVRINGSVNLALPSLIQRRLLRGNLATPVALGYCGGSKIGEEQWKSSVIVLYDDDTLTSQSSPEVTSEASAKVVSVLAKQLTKDGYTVCHLSGGLKEFRAKHPHLCTTRRQSEDGDSTGCIQSGFRNLRLSESAKLEPDDAETPTMTSSSEAGRGGGKTVPVEVLPHLYLGDAKNASDLECLEGNGIRYIVNVTPNVPNAFERNAGFRYLQIPIKDHWSQSLTNYFPQAITFIDEGRRLNAGVLVHCLAGISRSVTVTVAYLMYSMSLSLNDAYDYVKQRKPNVSPNLTFMGQLLDFENALKVDRQRYRCPSASSCSSSSTSPCSFCSSNSSSESETGNCRQEAG